MSEEKPVIYVSGRITGVPDLNKPKFAEATKRLRAMGYIVRNPHEFCADVPPDSDCHHYMRICIAELMKCEMVLFLDDWFESKGATIERRIASDMEIPCVMYEIFVQMESQSPAGL